MKNETYDFDEEYLWDQSGKPDAETARLERVLGTLKYDPDEHEFDAKAPARRPLQRFALPAAVAAALLVGVFGYALYAQRAASYAVEGLPGLARVGAGDRVVTENESEARLSVAELGSVQVLPGSRLRVEEVGEDQHRFFLERGAIRAQITAEPRVFQVGTPAGLTVDLGCEYDLAVDDEGVARLSVAHGRVAFETEGRKVLVPARASCESVPGRGPDTPHFDDASPAFVGALEALEYAPEPDLAVLATLLDEARRDDSLSLWHLLDAPAAAVREAVYDKLATMYPTPPDATREGLLAGDEDMRAAWRRELERDWHWN